MVVDTSKVGKLLGFCFCCFASCMHDWHHGHDRACMNFAPLRREASFLEHVTPKTQRKKKRQRVIESFEERCGRGTWPKEQCATFFISVISSLMRHIIFSGLWKTPKNSTHHKFIVTSLRSKQNGKLEMTVFANNKEKEKGRVILLEKHRVALLVSKECIHQEAQLEHCFLKSKREWE